MLYSVRDFRLCVPPISQSERLEDSREVTGVPASCLCTLCSTWMVHLFHGEYLYSVKTLIDFLPLTFHYHCVCFDFLSFVIFEEGFHCAVQADDEGEILLLELQVCAPHLCSPGWSGTRYVDQTRFDLTEIGLAARSAGIRDVRHHVSLE